FIHALHREFIYSGISPVLRSSLHRCLAERLESLHPRESSDLLAALVLHFDEGRQYDRAIHWLLVRAQAAARRLAHRDAIALLRQALALVSRVSPEQRLMLQLQVLERLGDSHYALGEMSESVAMYERQAIAAERATLAPQHAHALMCQAAPLGLVDPDQAMR